MELEKLCRRYIDDLIQNENVIEPSCDIMVCTKPGDGYMATHVIVKITGRNKILNCFIKIAPTNENFRRNEVIDIAFSSECIFYNRISPVLLNFEKEKKKLNPLKSIPVCYKVVSEEFKEAIILEDLNVSGCRILDRRSFMPTDYVKLVLQEFGHFHAISFGLKDQNKTIFEEIISNIKHPFDNYPELDILLPYLINNGRKSLNPIQDKTVIDIYEKFAEGVIRFMKNLNNTRYDKYSIIVHADGWCNNFMFHYEVSK